MYQWAHGYCGKVVAVEANDAFKLGIVLNIYNPLSKVHVLAKFQPHMLITLGITEIQTEKSICTANIGKINYRWLLKRL